MKRQINFIILELDSYTFHPLIEAEFEGLQNHWWVIDSGASKTVMDIHFSNLYTAEELEPVMATGLGKELVSTNSGIIPELVIGGINFGSQKVALTDFTHINQEYSKFSDKKIIGLIGCDFLFNHEAVIDFKNKFLLL